MLCAINERQQPSQLQGDIELHIYTHQPTDKFMFNFYLSNPTFFLKSSRSIFGLCCDF